MGRFFVLPYKMASEGGKMLADALEGLRIRLEGSEYRYQEGDTIVNWGNGDIALPLSQTGAMINPSINICINKRDFFSRMQGHNIVPPFAFSRDEAIRHLEYPIVCRTTVEGADGQGIFIANDPGTVPTCRLYTQLLEKTAEYRVHLGRTFSGDIVLIAAQKKRLGLNQGIGPIWTGENVYLDYLEPSELPRHVFDVTKRSMELMPELHFGGFDTLDTPVNGARVVEVNSAPMMTPQVTSKYAAFIKQYAVDRDVPVAAEEDPTETADYQAGFAAGRASMFEILQRCWQENDL